jgi:hypothetical protein
MSSETPAQASNTTAPEKVFVPIPKAGPGQGYQAPKNYQQPAVDAVSRVIVGLLCLSLPVVPAGLIVLLLATDLNARNTLLWLFIPLGVFVTGIGVLVALGIWREAVGSAGGGWYEREPS